MVLSEMPFRSELVYHVSQFKKLFCRLALILVLFSWLQFCGIFTKKHNCRMVTSIYLILYLMIIKDKNNKLFEAADFNGFTTCLQIS